MMQLRGTTSRKDPEGERVAVAKNIRAVMSFEFFHLHSETTQGTWCKRQETGWRSLQDMDVSTILARGEERHDRHPL